VWLPTAARSPRRQRSASAAGLYLLFQDAHGDRCQLMSASVHERRSGRLAPEGAGVSGTLSAGLTLLPPTGVPRNGAWRCGWDEIARREAVCPAYWRSAGGSALFPALGMA
jgi:hypothetical protein